ncbi:NCS2 family permease [Candidatus Hepatincolaceae symbiont of Richtersius coronifer]
MVVFFASFFDSFGSFVSYSYFINPKKMVLDKKDLRKAMTIEGVSCSLAGVLGTSPTSIFLESNAGVSAGGRTGLTSLVVGVLFLFAILFSPLIKTVPIWAAAPVLIFLGCLMLSSLKNINWDSDFSETIPSIICLIFTPLTYSITTGIGAAFISYCILKMALGKYKDIPMFTLILAVLFFINFML